MALTISSVSLIAHSVAQYNAAIEFYTHVIGFSVVSCEEAAVAQEASTVMGTFKDSTIRLKYSANGAKTPQFSAKDSREWRSKASCMVFWAPSLADLYSRCTDAGFDVQTQPDSVAPAEMYVIDPLDNVVGFTCSDYAFSAMPATRPLLHGSSPRADVVKPSSKEKIAVKKLAVMTSGGDAPGMNPHVRSVVRSAISRGCQAYAIFEGYDGLVNGYIKPMSWDSVRGWLREGGTNIGTARCAEFREKAGRLKAALNLIHHGIDALVVCGGDGSLTGADVFRGEWPDLVAELLESGKISAEQYNSHKHLNICGTVGSIDNDMSNTDATIGAYSSLARICQAVDYIDATADSHSRAFIIEVMGRHCGWLALMAGIATSADYIMIPEKPANKKDWKQQMCDIVRRHRAKGKRKTIVLVAEGAITNDLVPISAQQVASVLIDLGLDTRVTTLGHVQRGGTAVAYDRILATLQGVEAVNAVLECKPGAPSPMIAIEENKIVRRSLVDAVAATKSVAQAIGAKDFKKAMSLRDSEFIEHLSQFVAINSADQNEPSLPREKRMNLAIVNVGAPAGGMNSAVYSFATYCMSRGHTPYAIHNGFTGLARHQSIRKLEWKEVEGWNSLGGSEIGTNRVTPNEADIGMIAYYLEKYEIEGLVLVGGFEAFVSLNQLEEARFTYPGFRIPMVLIPATISNNVPGTEYSLGSDTCLNSLMEYCDTIKQSASATRNRVFVVEIQGGNSGFIATMGQLIVGANVSYVPEEGISLSQLEQDVEMLKKSFEKDSGEGKTGRLIMKSENASKVFGTEILAKIINEESDGRFEAKTSVPGHVQQGGTPSVIDRTRAAKFACRAVEFIESQIGILKNAFEDEDYGIDMDDKVSSTASVIGVKSSKIVFSPIRNLYDFETDTTSRIPKEVYWNPVRIVADSLVGRSRLPVN